MPIAPLRLSLLHLAPVAGDPNGNCRAIRGAVCVAAERGAELAVTPELALSGYLLPGDARRTEIAIQPDRWLRAIAQMAWRCGVAVLVGAAERNAVGGTIHNSAFLIDSTGEMVGRCRKINVAPDGWSSPGNRPRPMRWRSLAIGCLICADAYTPDIAARLQTEGADMLLSPANWGPGEDGPNGEWEQRSRETGLTVIVCNRTGRDQGLDFSCAESLVIVGGARRFVHRLERPCIITLDLDRRTWQPLDMPLIDPL